MARPANPENADRKMWSLRLTDDEKAAIQRRAQAANLDMGRFMVACALGNAPKLEKERDRTLADVVRRLERLEKMAELGGLDA